jgi:AcrR family transcriptional regulator
MYHYFTDKKELIQAVVAHQAAAAVHAQLAMGPLDSIEALQAWVDFHLETQRRRHCVGGCTLGSLVSQVAESDPIAREQLDAGFTAWEQPISAGLQMMQDRGELSAGADPRQLGVAAIAALEGGLLLTQIQRSLAPLESALTTFLSYVESVANPRPAVVDGGAHQLVAG